MKHNSKTSVTAHTRTCWAAALALAACSAAADSAHDIHFLAEHVAESGMDAHYQSLPWPAGRLSPSRWQTSLDASNARTHTDFIELDGSMLAFAVATGATEHWGYEILGFDSTMRISGSGGRAALGGFIPGTPLDVPALAEYSRARGELREYGIGAAALLTGRARAPSSAQLVFGALLERTDVTGFELDYRLVEGADAGIGGVLDHSSSATFLTPFVGWEQTRPLARRWDWSPRALFAMPLPPANFDARLTGPGFDVSTRPHGSVVKFGDPFATFGLALTHRPSGFEIDLGGMLFFGVAEHVSHPGVDHAVLTHVAWRSGGRGARE